MSKSKFFKFIIAGIFIFIIGILQGTNVEAKSYSSAKNLALYGNVGDTMSLNLDILTSDKGLYCIQHMNGYMTTTHKTTYKVNYKISINGVTATSNGKRVDSVYNAWLAYVLGGGSYSYGYGKLHNNTTRQYALWELWEEWNSNVGSKLNAQVPANDGNKAIGVANKLYYEAQEYADSGMSGASSIKLVSANKVPTKDENGKLYGPFKVKYTGGIESISIIGDDGSDITGKITIRNSSGTTVYKNKAWVGNYGLPNNQEFYIYLENGSQNENENINLKSITLTARANNVIKADICVLTSNETKDLYDTPNSQRLIAVATSYGPGEASSITIDDIITETELTVEKIDSTSLEALEGAKFILHHKNKFAQANDLGNGVYKVTNWTDNKDEATQLVVGKSGIKIKIQRDDEVLYALTEVEAPEGYEKSIGINNYTGVTLSEEYGNAYGIELSEKNGSKIYFELKYQKTAKMILTNSKKVSLIINKVDADDKNIKLNNVEFYLKHRNQYAVASFYDATGHYTVVGWTDNQEEATKFITGNNIDDGQLIIDFAEDGTSGSKRTNRHLYGLEEVNNPNEGYDKTPIFIEGSNVYESGTADNKISFFVNYSKNSDGTYTYNYSDTVNLTVGNKQPEMRIITIKKVSSADGTTPVNATFVLAHNNSYAGLQKNSEGIYEIVNWYSYVREEYNLNSKEVTKFKLENGEAKIKVPFDTELYSLIEVSTESNYNINMAYLSDKSSNITPLNGPSKVWSSLRGIDKNGILNNYEVDSIKTSQFYFYINQDTNKDSEIKICLNNEAKENVKGLIEGYVWKDSNNNKLQTYNNIYDKNDGDSLIEGVRVSLRDASTDKEVAHAYTDSNGKYNFDLANDAITTTVKYKNKDYTITFKNNNVKTMRNYYLQFDYSTLYKLKSIQWTDKYLGGYSRYEDLYGNEVSPSLSWDSVYNSELVLCYEKNDGYSSYVPVEDSYEENGSRGISLYDNSGNRITGKSAIYLEDALIKKFYDSKSSTLSNMNVGIIPEQNIENFPIKEQLEYVKIVMNNYTYYYEYGKSGTVSNAPEVKYQVKNGVDMSKFYSRPVYPSDIYKSIADNWTNGIKVYAVYSITITNPVTTDTNNYSEKYMEVTKLQNIYDNSRYMLSYDTDNYDNSKLGNSVQDLKLWKDSGNSGTATYDSYSSRTEAIGRNCGHMDYSYVEDEYVTGCSLNSSQYVTKYIKFELTQKAKEAILNEKQIIEKYPTTAQAWAKHYYGYTGKHWVSTGNGEGYYCTFSGRNHTSEQEAKDSAPYLLFSTGEERIITGTVFNDNVVTENGEVLGNGVYNSEDGTVENVKVELILANNSYNYKNEPSKTEVATIYTKEHPDGEQASIITTSDGNFKIEGITPGQYYLKFTYPDGTTKIYNKDGTTTDVKINDYKSTIVTDANAKGAILMCENILNNADSLGWYRDLQDASHSVAVDNLERRETYNSEYWKNKYDDSHPDISTTEMIAGTALFEIKVENKDENSGENLKDGSAIHEYTYNGFNFGIVRQPIQKASIEKVISNVKLVNGPQTIYDGNPNEKPENGVTDLDGDKDNKGSTYTRIEIAEDTLYGATLTLTYELRVNNESELNYYEVGNTHKGYYYMFGEVYDDTKVVELYTNVEDYLDKNLTYSANTNNAKLIDGKSGITVDKIISQNKTEITQIGNTSNPIDVKDTLLYTLEYNNFIQKDKTETVLINSYKTLSEQEEEWNYDNSARIKILANKPSKDYLNNDGTEKDPTSIGLVITPVITEPKKVETNYEHVSTAETIVTTPTGLDKKTIILYISTGVISLIILSAGIIIIKKKII